MIAALQVPPIAHLGHWASVLYALPILVLGAWYGFVRLRDWWRRR